ncbi:MAG TPA: protein-(glutamine-N5) methyltransferase, release factor-specific, partial [Cryomorphaceae bacterium]|nr:protein-(glutamine-N5) methyltransferase, release factor-specific [Cryomorphaceae bacterium]
MKDSFIQGLKQNYSSSEAEQLFYMAIDHLWTLSRTDYLRDSGKEWEKDTSGLHRIVLRLLQHEPIQYIIGETLFYGLRIKLNRHTLIPRPETEELMERIKNSDLQPETILDAGSGSGCIALALKRIFPAAHCTGVDISEGALQLARQNAVLNGLEVSFRQMDILKSENLQQSFDLIVSNPPYVAEAEKENMSAGVTDHEPYTALFVPDADPLVFY